MFKPADARREHAMSTAWLASELAKGEPARTVIVTHHAPHRQSIAPRYARDPLTAAYASDLTRLMGKSRYWIHGHMHDSSRYTVDGTEVVSNPRGYMRRDGALENSAFDPTLVIEI
jgi:Icc-related predicted phosphoesterase